jgi:ADP-ribosylglycohydrolase
MTSNKEPGEGMNREQIFSRAYGCLMGGCIGDAMGAPAEGKPPERIKKLFGEIRDFEGAGTDDTLLRHYLCDALIAHDGYITADEWAEQFRLRQGDKEYTRWYFYPVANANLKLTAGGVPPMECGGGNAASSSSAMCNSPLGLINAGSPREAALEAFMTASLIHHNFCRYAASAAAAAVAEAMNPKATVESVMGASIRYLPPESAEEFIVWHNRILGLLEKSNNNYQTFRTMTHKMMIKQHWALCDSRDTVNSALALFKLAGGDPVKTIIYGANFGRDTDTIACMAGGIAGAFGGIGAFPKEWVEKVKKTAVRDQEEIARKLTGLIVKRLELRKVQALLFS